MISDKVLTPARFAILSLPLAIGLAGCKAKPADDATLNTQVQSRLASDQNLSAQPIQTSVSGGIVTLNGTVSSPAARDSATTDAAQVAGIKTVVDNLVTQPPAPAPATATAAPPQPATPAQKPQKPSAMIAQQPQYQPAPIVRSAPAPTPAPQPAPTTVASAPPPPPPAVPVIHNITLPAGTVIPVRITQTLDSATTQTGDKFTGAIASDLIIDGLVVLPQGTPVTGHVDAAQDATHFKGSSLLTISLSSITHHGDRIEVATDAYTAQGEARGKNTAEKVGGGAAVGAILGGIFGGGKGAAIGAAAGGGLGAGANAATRGQQVQIESETVVRFKLSDPILVHVTTGGNGQESSGPALEHHTDQ